MLRLSVACALLAGFAASLALLGYVVDLPVLAHVRTGLEGMSPLTATAILCLAAALVASAREHPLTRLAATFLAFLVAATTLLAHLVHGADTASLWVGTTIFRMQAAAVGRTSIGTALCVLLVATSLAVRRKPAASDAAAGASLVVSAVALLGYLYGVRDLYALPMFNSMAINTAGALFLLSFAALCAQPKSGWAALLVSDAMGGRATRRQLPFLALPILAGKLLLIQTDAGRMAPSVAMALLVMVIDLPLAVLILRDGLALDAIERERRDKLAVQARLTAEMEERLARQEADLARAAEERIRAQASVFDAQRLEAVGHLTRGIAHDFNNLLLAIQGNLELLDARLPQESDPLRHFLREVEGAAAKGARITAQLLTFSRSQRLDIRDVEVDAVLATARELVMKVLGPKIRLETYPGCAGTWVKTDAGQLELAILNLAVNSRDALPQGGRIRIESAECVEALAPDGAPTPCVAIRVTDNGGGMSAEVAARAIEPFFTTKEQGSGTGLGLAQVFGFARQCEGDLRIASTPGYGTTVEILLRRSEAPSPAPDTAPIRADGGGRLVLVIDDDEAVRAVIVHALQSEGFDVIDAADGRRGLELLRTATPAVAVIDFLMPGMNGAEVAAAARELHPTLPIVFMSGYAETSALEAVPGAAILRKPFRTAALRGAVDAVMS